MPPKKTHIVKRTKKESSNSAPADVAPPTPAAAGKTRHCGIPIKMQKNHGIFGSRGIPRCCNTRPYI